MTYQLIDTHCPDTAVCHIILNRPDKRQALNLVMIEELTHALQTAIKDDDIRVIVLKSSCADFCAGADLNEMKASLQLDWEANVAHAMTLSRLFQLIHQASKPIMTVVSGRVMGGGIGLVAASPLVIAANDSTFCFSEAKLGLIPAMISPYVVKAIGQRQAHYWFLTAARFDASSAHHMGLCHQVVTPDALTETTNSLTKQLIHNGPNALTAIHALLNDLPTLSVSDLAERLAHIRTQPEAQEGLQAFFEKRQPHWCDAWEQSIHDQ